MRLRGPKIRNKLIIGFFLLAFIPLTALAFFTFEKGKADIVSSTSENVLHLVQIIDHEIGIIVNDIMNDTVQLARLPHFATLAERIMTDPSDDGAKEEMRRYLFAYVYPIGEMESSFFLHPATGEVLCSSDPTMEGKFFNKRPYFVSGKKKPTIYPVHYSPSRERSILATSVPVTKHHELLGVVSNWVDLEHLRNKIKLKSRATLYLVNKSNLCITEPPVRDGALPVRCSLFTEGAVRALDGETGNGIYDDPSGIEVVGAFTFVESLGLALLAEVPLKDVLTDVNRFGMRILFITLALALLSLMASILIGRRITNPLVEMSMVAGNIASGKLDERVTYTSSDELGELSKTMNRMAEKISQREKALRESEEKYRNLFEDSKDVVFISTPEGRFVDINAAGVELFGYESRDELLRIDLARDLYENSGDRQDYRRAIEAKGFVKDYEVSFKRKDGRKVVVLITSNTVRNEKGDIVYYRGIMHDITEQKQLEQQLLHSQKLEAIGRLAGGIAHDINNYLGAISGYSELVKLKWHEDEETSKRMDSIRDTVGKASSLIKQLLAFGRKQHITPEVLNLNHVIDSMKGMMKRVIGEDIILETNLEKDLHNVTIDLSQVEQILANLLVNSRDAMPKGGKIIMVTKNVEFDSDYLMKHPVVTPGKYVMLAVSDTGIGIPDEVKEKIFEPFFTTKKLDIGSGLGLSTVYGIVKQNNGYIWVYSELNEGTTFKIYFPICEEEVSGSIMESFPHTRALGGSEKVLLVEDNDDVRESTELLLKSMGYAVISAGNGGKAIEIFQHERKEFDLLITDIVMPGMNGKDLAEHILNEKDDIKVLFISGYTDELVARYGMQSKGIHFLDKPFSSRALGEKIRQLLD